MADNPNMHVLPIADQLSPYSTLSGAMVPTKIPIYLLPQRIYYPVPSIYSQPANIHVPMAPIVFHDLSGDGIGVPLKALCVDKGMPISMKNGSDLVFARYPHMHSITLRIMVRSNPYFIKLSPPLIILSVARILRICWNLYHKILARN